jgi:hypothetical protein
MRECSTHNEEVVSISCPIATCQSDCSFSWRPLHVGLSIIDRRLETLQARRENCRHYCALAADRTDILRPDLSCPLLSLSIDLAKSGRYEEALKVNREDANIYRILVADRPETVCSGLVPSLVNLSTYQSILEN